MSQTLYHRRINNRSSLRYYLGLVARLKKHLYYSFTRFIAKKNGASIGECSVISFSLAKRANINLTVGSHTSIQTDLIDLRAPVKIGNNVIISSGVEIITCSHDIDSAEWEFKPYGIEIEDYAWIATRVFILPSCRKISKGAVCAAGSVVVRNVEEMIVVGGNPATFIKYRKEVHSNLIVESLLSGDFKQYKIEWKNK